MLISTIRSWVTQLSHNAHFDSSTARCGRKRKTCRRRRASGSASVEICEPRMMLTTFIVDSPLDTVDASDGQTTLREAIQQANANAGHDTVLFNISGAPTPISLDSALPIVIDSITIDGSTQPEITIDATGVSGTILRLNDGADGSVVRDISISNATDIALVLNNVSDSTIEAVDLSLNAGTAVGSGRNRGLQLSNSTNNTVRNITATNRSAGIRLDHSSGNLLVQNTVGQGTTTGIFIGGVSDSNIASLNDASDSQTGIIYAGSGNGNQFVDNDLSGTSGYGLSIARDEQFVATGNDFTASAKGVELRFMDAITLTPSPTFNLDVSTVTGVGLGLVGVTNSTIDGLDLSYSGSTADGTGLAVTFGSHGNTIRNVTATDRSIGISLAAGADANTVENSDFRRSASTAINLSGPSSDNLVRNNDASDSRNGINAFVTGLGNQFVDNDLSGAQAWALTIRNDSQFVSTGNDLSGSANGVFLGFMDGLTLTPSETFDIDVSQVSGIGVSLIGVTNSVIHDVDFSYSGEDVTGTGLQLNNSAGIELSDVTVAGRVRGLDINNTVNTQILCSSLVENTVGLRVVGASPGAIVNDSQIADNDTGIQNLSTATVLAENNYWGAADGPSNLGGSGDSYIGNVDADPFLTRLPDCLVDVQPVDVDVKPDNSENKVNAKSQGVIPVAIYTTADFDATTIVGSSVQLAGISTDHFALEDVDGDGDLDLILHFNTQAVITALGVDLASGESVSVEAELTGETIDEVMIQGFDTIEFFQPGKGKGKSK